jgi:hypothetical protein
MKTFFRKLFNLRTDKELVGLLYLHYEDWYICYNLERGKYKDVLTMREHRRLLKLVTVHLEGAKAASTWCYKRGLITQKDFLESHCEKRHRKIFLASLYDSTPEKGQL